MIFLKGLADIFSATTPSSIGSGEEDFKAFCQIQKLIGVEVIRHVYLYLLYARSNVIPNVFNGELYQKEYLSNIVKAKVIY